MQLIKSPLNYTGNKYRIMDQIRKYLPENMECMIDLFCGDATVGLNTNTQKIKKFISSNSSIYKEAYNQSFGQIKKLLKKGGI